MSFEKFCQIISEVTNVPLKKINQNSSFRDDLNIDSLQMVNLIVELSSKFGVEGFKIRSNHELSTVQGLYQMVTRQGLNNE